MLNLSLKSLVGCRIFVLWKGIRGSWKSENVLKKNLIMFMGLYCRGFVVPEIFGTIIPLFNPYYKAKMFAWR